MKSSTRATAATVRNAARRAVSPFAASGWARPLPRKRCHRVGDASAAGQVAHAASVIWPVTCCASCARRRFHRFRCWPRCSVSSRCRRSREPPSRRPCSSACTTMPSCSRGGLCIRWIRGRGTSDCRAGAGRRGTGRCSRRRCGRPRRSSASIRLPTGGCSGRSVRTSAVAGGSPVCVSRSSSRRSTSGRRSICRPSSSPSTGCLSVSSCPSTCASTSFPIPTLRRIRSSFPPPTAWSSGASPTRFSNGCGRCRTTPARLSVLSGR